MPKNAPKKLGLIHTSATLVPVFAGLCREKLPGVEVFNIVDDSLIKDVIEQGMLTDTTAARVGEYIRLAAMAGADRDPRDLLVDRSRRGRGGRPFSSTRSPRGSSHGGTGRA